MMEYLIAEDGAHLAYRDEGSRSPDALALIALAGLTRDGRDFDYLARKLGPLGLAGAGGDPGQGGDAHGLARSGESGALRLIRLDCRGRGGSDWTGAASYTLQQEARDVLALMDHLSLARAAVIGTSRGGLIGLVLAQMAPERLKGLCLNDVGPVLERAGLARIGRSLGLRPSVTTLAEVAERLPLAAPGFAGVPALRWQEETVRRYVESAGGGLDLPYDPALRAPFLAALDAPAGDAWPLFAACAGMPLALIHGAGSDLLSPATVAEMCRLRPDMIVAEVPGRGHVPFLDEPESLAAIAAWLAQMRARRQLSAALAGRG